MDIRVSFDRVAARGDITSYVSAKHMDPCCSDHLDRDRYRRDTLVYRNSSLSVYFQEEEIEQPAVPRHLSYRARTYH